MAGGPQWRSEAAAVVPGSDGERLLALFVVASLPAAAIAAWHAGVATVPGSGFSAAVAGLVTLAPQAGMALATAAAWERLFARLRGRSPDAGWLAPAWLYALLLPPGVPLVYVAAGMSFGVVFGMHVFGGSGRYVASPAIVGVLFLQFAYPAIGSEAGWTSLAAWPAGLTSGAWLFLSACAAGALALVAVGAASWRIPAGAIAGLVLATLPAMLSGDPAAPVVHAASGAFAFCAAFVLTDPTTTALTRAGRYTQGLAFALLVVLIRETDPARPDGVLTAALLAGLLVPLADSAALELRRRWRGPRLELHT